MMKLKVSEWKEFRLDRLFVLKGGFYNKKPEHSVDGRVPFLGSTENDNGVTEFYSLDDIRSWDKVGLPDDSLDGKLFDGGCVAVTVNGSVCNAFYQAEQFTCSHDITALYIPGVFMTEFVGLFIASIIMKDKYRWSYGRKPHSVEKLGKSIISLPIQHDVSGQPLIDPLKKYSDDGYVPDWDFMEQYMMSLNTQSLVTQRGKTASPTLGVEAWKEFPVGRLFEVQLSKGDIKPDDVDDGEIPLVSSGESNNGVVAYLSKDGDGKADIFTGNRLTIDMFCHAFYQPDDFFAVSHGRVNVLSPLFDISVGIGLFIATVLNGDEYKYSYGRALYSNVANKMMIRLPVQHDAAGQPMIEPSRKYSDDGYIPDWAFMEQYIGSLPGSDLLK